MSEVQAALSGPDLVKRVALSTLADGRDSKYSTKSRFLHHLLGTSRITVRPTP